MGGVDKMLTFAYMVGGWVKAHAYISNILEITRTYDMLGEIFLIISQPHLNFRSNNRVQIRFLQRKVVKIRTNHMQIALLALTLPPPFLQLTKYTHAKI